MTEKVMRFFYFEMVQPDVISAVPEYVPHSGENDTFPPFVRVKVNVSEFLGAICAVRKTELSGSVTLQYPFEAVPKAFSVMVYVPFAKGYLPFCPVVNTVSPFFATTSM